MWGSTTDEPPQDTPGRIIRRADMYRRRIAYLTAGMLVLCAFLCALLDFDWLMTQLVWLASVFFVAGLLLSVWSDMWTRTDD